ncbi:MAG: VWA-like domain-containing protein, partial [Lachnospiraceae bacterium]|nr:VWA-like domain-containing protein [Lachnospiraceae bacterium]
KVSSENAEAYIAEEKDRTGKKDINNLRNDSEDWNTDEQDDQDAREEQNAQDDQETRKIPDSWENQDSQEDPNSPENPEAIEAPFDAGDFDAQLAQDWLEIAETVMLNAQSFAKEQGDLPGSMVQTLQRLTRESYDYTEFLKKFATLEECMKLNLDEFDYLYYLYGLKTLGRIALIEPLEYKEEYLVREFVIAIDTSGSCSGDLVQKFLNKTYNILKSTESFSRKVAIHVIQCDCAIQEDTVIESLEDLDRYTENLEIKGLGGTDFRPVFTYVEELCAKKAFRDLRGLIYFTDGYGTFPERPPRYKTAFVFVNREDQVRVPPWAMRMYLDEDSVENKKRR